MIKLHTLGDALITVGEKEVRPTAPMIFAALLYLCVERGHRVSRTALQEMLFPEAGERSGAHSLRQLLYKLRQLGVPLEADAASIMVPAGAVHDPGRNGNGKPTEGSLAALAAPFLHGYEPRVSLTFDAWLEERRSAHVTHARKLLLAALAQVRDSGNYQGMEEAASALLTLDPLNEEATFARAEALALSGQKHDAVKLLDDYAEEVGETSPQLRLSADVLRRRITDRLAVRERPVVPLLGRDEELGLLLSHFQRAAGGQGTVSIIWGDAGIGKTRLVQEFSANIALRAARLETAHCQPHDVGRPLGALIDLVPKLLTARGALGVSPESLAALRRLGGDTAADPELSIAHSPELLEARIREAIKDLFVCVAAEAILTLIVEDAHWLDEASLTLLLGTIPQQQSRIHLIVTRRDWPRFATDAVLSPSVFVRHLEPLDGAASANLLSCAVGDGFSVEADVREQCVALGGGNPLFLCTIGEHLRQGGTAPPTKAKVSDLLRQRIRVLDVRALLLLRATAILGNHATQERLTKCTGMRTESELLAIQELSSLGLVVRMSGVLKCSHDLLSDIVIADAPSAIRVSIYERIAAVLEVDGTVGKQAGLLWSCAEYWLLADNRDRAASVLIRCAEYAVELGQSKSAGEALDKAIEIVSDANQLELLEQAVRILDLAYLSEAVLEYAERYRHLRQRSGLDPTGSHVCEIAALNALRRKGHSIWPLASRLRQCATDTRSPREHRLRAARFFVVSAEQNLGKDQAVPLLEEIRRAGLFAEADEESLHLSMIFECLLGSMDKAESEAERLLSLRTTSLTARAILMGNCGMVLFRTGATARAIEVMHEAIRIHERLSITRLLAVEYARVANCYCITGDIVAATHWNAHAGLL